VFRLGLQRAFERERDLDVVWGVASTAELHSALASDPVTLVLLDLNLGPGQDSLAATRSVVRQHPTVKVVMLSASLDTEVAGLAQKAGAIAFLAKDMALGDLVLAVKQLALQDRGTAFPGFGTDSRQGSVHKASLGHGLTRREREVLREVRHGRTSREIAELLGVSIPTINKHVQKVLQKLDVRNRAQAIARLDAESAARGYRDFDAGS